MAIRLAGIIGGEIVSCDSMQIYRHMDIGTAKPTANEMKTVRHHMIDVADPSEYFTAADWAQMASVCIDDIISRGKVPVICGGTGLYLDSLLRPVPFSDYSPDLDTLEKRKELEEYYEKNGKEALFGLLKQYDPEEAEKIHPNNVKRVIRAIEIYLTTGKKKSESDRDTAKGDPAYDCLPVNMLFDDREILYQRINARVEKMFDEGLENEVRALLSDGTLPRGSNAAQAIGYKETIEMIDEGLSAEETIEKISQNTRRYAKRQITWFRKYDDIIISPDRAEAEDMTAAAVEKIRDFLA